VYFAIFLFWSLWGFWTARHVFVNGLMEMNTNSPRLSKRYVKRAIMPFKKAYNR
jgi:hypothetical protein